MQEEFYKAFEDRYRGSRELIKSRVSVYLPIVNSLQKIHDNCNAIDLGCGRGEWLEILQENGISAMGVDENYQMLDVCKKYNLNVQKSDIISFIKGQADASISLISALHVVEHISFEDLKILAKESLRVLKKGGIIILETPNPENIRVSMESFYLDPTHTRPIPSGLLTFLMEFYKYKRVKILKLQESKELSNKEDISILQVIDGVSPDYAVVAQKDAEKDILEQFDDIFSQKSGISLEMLAEKFEKRLIKIEKNTHQLLSASKETLLEINILKEKINSIELKEKSAQEEYNKIINSNSWRVTRPLRLLMKMIKR